MQYHQCIRAMVRVYWPIGQAGGTIRQMQAASNRDSATMAPPPPRSWRQSHRHAHAYFARRLTSRSAKVNGMAVVYLICSIANADDTLVISIFEISFL